MLSEKNPVKVSTQDDNVQIWPDIGLFIKKTFNKH